VRVGLPPNPDTQHQRTNSNPLETATSLRFASITPVHGAPICTGRVSAISDSGGERLATVELSVALPDGTVTLLGDAQIALD
jgi:hypothetical protein